MGGGQVLCAPSFTTPTPKSANTQEITPQMYASGSHPECTSAAHMKLALTCNCQI